MVDHPHFMPHSDWREHFKMADINDATCKLIIVTDDELEILRRALAAAKKRANWEASESADGYITPDDDEWDTIDALLADLEERLMSACDYVTLDDADEHVGIGDETPEAALEIVHEDELLTVRDAASEEGLWIAEGTSKLKADDNIGITSPSILLSADEVTGLNVVAGTYGVDVGIGVAAPDSILDLQRVGLAGQPVEIDFHSPLTNDANTPYKSGRIYAKFDSTTSSTSRLTLANNVGGSFVDVLSLKNSKVGVGNTSPSYALDVTGDIRATTKFGCNGKTPQGAYSVNAACTDLPTAIALLNQIRLALIAIGICA